MNAKLKVKQRYTGIVGPVVVIASTLILLWGGMVRAEHDITSPGDMVESFPNDNGLPSAGHPALVIDDNINTSCYLEFKGGTQVTGFRVEPLVGPTVVTGLNFTAAGNAPERDPIAFELCGSNISIDGPYELIVSGDIVDFAQESAWPRRTKNKTPILFDNSIAYTYYQVLFTAVRGQWSASGVQIAEVELLATALQATSPEPINSSVVVVVPQLQWKPGDTAVYHDLYFGTNPEPGPAEYISRLSTNIYNPTTEFKSGITYYWRVDEVEADGTVHTGTVWNFTFGAKASNPDPADRAVDVNLPLLQWTAGTGTGSQIVYLGRQGEELTQLDPNEGEWLHDFHFIPVERQLEPGATYEWKVDEVLDNNEIITGDVWRFTTRTQRPLPSIGEPLAWWTFDDGAGLRAKDAIGSRDGIVRGPSWILPNDTDSYDFIGAALNFDGDYDWVEISDVGGLFDESFSISCWVWTNPEDANGQVIFSQQGGVNWLMVGDSWGLLKSELAEPASSSGVILSPGTWTSVCITLDREIGSLIIYLNGVYTSSQPIIEPSPISLESPIYIGCGSDQSEASFWNGVIDEVRIFDRALPLEDLDTLMKRNANIVTDKYYTGLTTSKHIRIDLNYDKTLAAVISEDATDKQIIEDANSLGLRVVKIDRPNQIVRLELPFAISRMEATKFTRAARKLLDDSSFLEIGLAVTPGAAETSVLVNEQFTVQLDPNVVQHDPNAINEFTKDGRARVVQVNPYNPNEYLLEVTAESKKDAMALANEYHLNSNTIYSVPNLAIVPVFRGNSPVQWHLNDEPNDADIDAQEAWKLIERLALDNPDVNIAVIDSRVDYEHEAFKGNLWTNPGEIPGNGIDDDNNLYKDDVHGCNFGYNNGLVHEHGTAVAGCIGANGTNPEGVCGSCPDCKLMFLRCNITTFDQHLAFDYARGEGADVICCSWGYKAEIEAPIDVRNSIFNAATFGRVRNVNGQRRALGCVILFAMTNEPNDNGGYFPDISSLERVIAVSASTDQDKRSGAGYGDMMEVLAPTSGGTRSIFTIDVTGTAGYNNENPKAGCSDLKDLDYTQCFDGTSAACATAAGVAGLILSAEPNLYRRDVQRILQDTADKIDDSAGHYNPDDGFSMGSEGISTHGYGRINAFEAVLVAANGVDVFLRDHRLDWGNTSRVNNNNHYPEGNPISTTAFTSKAIEVTGTENGVDVSVLVRNRGPITATGVTVELYTYAGGENPSDFSLGANEWQLQQPETEGDNIVDVPYCGSSVAGLSTDPIKTVTFSLSNDSLNAALNQYIYLLAMAYCDDDPISFDLTKTLDAKLLAADDNNITMLRISWGQLP